MSDRYTLEYMRNIRIWEVWDNQAERWVVAQEACVVMNQHEKLLAACQALIKYRDSVGAVNFQLEKADDFIHAMRIAIVPADGEED